MKNIIEISRELNIDDSDIELYGNDKAKINFEKYKDRENIGHLILVTALTPTKVGEGKTTTAIGLVDGLNAINKKAILALREPSLGPVFGLKGGGTGGGKAKVEPEEDINLHFTGDFHALTTITNLIAAFIDNEAFYKSELNLDTSRITFSRCIDINDRSLRKVETCLYPKSGTTHKSSFVITSASEVMACFCLSKDIDEFVNRVNNIEIGYSFDNKRLFVKDLHIDNAIKKLIKHAINPNLVQTLYSSPCLIHGGPFANIAHGCNSIIATSLALKLADYVVTEAGFGSDLGMEKFFDIVCTDNNYKPELVILVATIQALKIHGGVEFDNINKENTKAIKVGFLNLKAHIENIKKYNVIPLVSINVHDSDTSEELQVLKSLLEKENFNYEINTSYNDGKDGAINLANKSIELLSLNKSNFKPLVNNEDFYSKVEIIAKNMYRSTQIVYSSEARNVLDSLDKKILNNFKVCISKTPSSLSDDPKILNVKENTTLHINSVKVYYGAKFIVLLTGNVILMPGLNKNPRGKNMKD